MGYTLNYANALYDAKNAAVPMTTIAHALNTATPNLYAGYNWIPCPPCLSTTLIPNEKSVSLVVAIG